MGDTREAKVERADAICAFGVAGEGAELIVNELFVFGLNFLLLECFIITIFIIIFNIIVVRGLIQAHKLQFWLLFFILKTALY